MQKSLLLVPVLALIVSACSEQNGYVFNGKTGDLNGKAVLTYRTSNQELVSDTVNMENGVFTFRGSVSEPVRGTVYIFPDGESEISASVFVENAVLNADFDLDNVVDYGRHGGRGFIENAITGGPNNEFWCGIRPMLDKRFSSDPQYSELYAGEQEIMALGYSDMALYDSLSEALVNRFSDILDAYSAEQDKAQAEYALAHPDVEAAAYLFRSNCEGFSLDEIETAFSSFTPEVQQSYLAEKLRVDIAAMKATAPGAEAPDFTLKNPEGTDVTLSSLRGQYVIIDFWASWCGPCRQGMPAMKELYAKYHEKGLEIIGVSDDSNEKDWLKAIEEDELPWIQTIDEFPVKNEPAIVGALYGVHYIPSYFLLDKEGKIIGKMEHDELEAKLAELL